MYSIRYCLLSLFFLLNSTPTVAQQESSLPEKQTFHEKWDLPDRPIGQRAAHMLEAMSRQDLAFSESFVLQAMDDGFKEMGIPRLIEGIHSWGETLGDFSIDKVVIKRPYRIELYLKGEDEQIYKMNMEVLDARPHLFAGIMPPQVFDPKMEIGEVPAFSSYEEADTYIKDLAEKGLFSGIIVVNRHGETEFGGVYGMANKEDGIPINPDTRFNLGSITKSFTRAAVMKLAEEKKLSLEDPMGKYLEQFPEEIASKVTVQHLVEMKSGYGDYLMGEDFQANQKNYRSIDDYMDLIKTLPLHSPPGEEERYSNAGYAILAGIIESASGMSYYDYVTENILKPAGMMNAGFPFIDNLGENTAIGYTNEGESGKKGYQDRATMFRPGRGSGAGGAYASAPELIAYGENNWLGVHPGGCNAGGAPGVSTITCWDTEKELIMVVLSNQDEPYPEDIGVSIYRMLNP